MSEKQHWLWSAYISFGPIVEVFLQKPLNIMLINIHGKCELILEIHTKLIVAEAHQTRLLFQAFQKRIDELNVILFYFLTVLYRSAYECYLNVLKFNTNELFVNTNQIN